MDIQTNRQAAHEKGVLCVVVCRLLGSGRLDMQPIIALFVLTAAAAAAAAGITDILTLSPSLPNISSKAKKNGSFI